MDTNIFYKSMIQSCKVEIKITKECIKQLKKVSAKHPYIEKYKNDIVELKRYIADLKGANV